MTTTEPTRTPMQRYLDADEAWSAEGQKVFGNQWGDARYTPAAHGDAGTALRAAYAEFMLARDAWEAAGRPLDRGYRCI